jgi:hypothetical protein
VIPVCCVSGGIDKLFSHPVFRDCCEEAGTVCVAPVAELEPATLLRPGAIIVDAAVNDAILLIVLRLGWSKDLVVSQGMVVDCGRHQPPSSAIYIGPVVGIGESSCFCPPYTFRNVRRWSFHFRATENGVPSDARDMKGSLESPPLLINRGEEHIMGNAQGSRVAESV